VPFLLQGVAGESALNQPDGIHPTAQGARIVADNVWVALEPIVKGPSTLIEAARSLEDRDERRRTAHHPASRSRFQVRAAGSSPSSTVGQREVDAARLDRRLDAPTSGQVLIDGVDITRLNEERWRGCVAKRLGSCFNSFTLIPSLTAYENVAVPMRSPACPILEVERKCS